MLMYNFADIKALKSAFQLFLQKRFKTIQLQRSCMYFTMQQVNFYTVQL